MPSAHVLTGTHLSALRRHCRPTDCSLCSAISSHRCSLDSQRHLLRSGTLQVSASIPRRCSTHSWETLLRYNLQHGAHLIYFPSLGDHFSLLIDISSLDTDSWLPLSFPKFPFRIISQHMQTWTQMDQFHRQLKLSAEKCPLTLIYHGWLLKTL